MSDGCRNTLIESSVGSDKTDEQHTYCVTHASGWCDVVLSTEAGTCSQDSHVLVLAHVVVPAREPSEFTYPVVHLIQSCSHVAHISGGIVNIGLIKNRMTHEATKTHVPADRANCPKENPLGENENDKRPSSAVYTFC